MNPKDFIEFVSNGMELIFAGVPMKAVDVSVSSSEALIVGGKLDEMVVNDRE